MPASPAAERSAAPHSGLRTSVPREVVLACCIAVPLCLLVCHSAIAGDPWVLSSLFQYLAIIFFAVLILRLLPPFHQHDALPEYTQAECAQAECAGPAGLLIALAVGTLAYARTVTFFFISDDFEHLAVLRQPFTVSLWPQFTRGQFDGHTYIFYRPLGFASLFLEYRLWHNWAPGYHLTSLVLHLLAVAGVYYFCKQLALSHRSCVAAALVFAVLPVNVQALTWSACRFDQLATTFGIWSLVSAAGFRRTGRKAFYWMGLLLFVLAVLSKENAYFIPLLWLALEFLTFAPQPDPSANRSYRSPGVWAPLLGYILVPLLMWALRIRILGGIGGYYLTQDGTPVAKHFGRASVTGILVHAPAVTLFGYNCLQSHRWGLIAAAVTAAIFLTLCFFAKTTRKSTRIVGFCLLWLFAAAAPAHFYFGQRDPALFYSRTLYFGSIAAAILIGTLLGQTFRSPDPKTHRLWTFAVVLLLAVSLQHNLEAWRRADRVSREFQAFLLERLPDPPPNLTLHIGGVPTILEGVPVFTTGLENAARFAYSWRTDIYVRHTEYENHRPPADAANRYLLFR